MNCVVALKSYPHTYLPPSQMAIVLFHASALKSYALIGLIEKGGFSTTYHSFKTCSVDGELCFVRATVLPLIFQLRLRLTDKMLIRSRSLCAHIDAMRVRMCSLHSFWQLQLFGSASARFSCPSSSRNLHSRSAHSLIKFHTTEPFFIGSPGGQNANPVAIKSKHIHIDNIRWYFYMHQPIQYTLTHSI